ncbi:MAG: pyruvate kinase [Elusimicrobia bacterium]|nr:MAG: pyruvate kinase [Elusimicrobiota bacterium]
MTDGELLDDAEPHKDVRKAKIVCTLGPSSNTQEQIDALALAGMDVVRLNFSHGAHDDHGALIKKVRDASRRLEKPMSIIADLQGPKIRTGKLLDGKIVQLVPGKPFTITTEPVVGTAERVGTTYSHLHEEVRKGDRILIDDGLIELKVAEVKDRDVRCDVINGGDLNEHKGINLPGVKLRIPALTEKDKSDLRFALEQGANYIAVSFVRSAEDVLEARQEALRYGKEPLLIAKLEKSEAIENLEEIMQASDGVMVARGDLGVEMSPEKVPPIQKHIIHRASEYRMPVITATQMLESMTRNPRPTRAEASDVANAIFDGTSAVMLSNETASGKYPLESVQMMQRIIREAEAMPRTLARERKLFRLSVAEAISEAATNAAEVLPVKVIAVFTETGTTARLIAHYRPPVPIIGFSPVQETRRRMALLWGVLPRKIDHVADIDELARTADARLIEEKLVRKGDLVVIVAGTPLGVRGTTNMIKLHTVGQP